MLRDSVDSLRRLATGPKSLQGSLALTVAGLLLAAILVLAYSAVGLLRKQADQQALVRTQLAGIAAREELRRVEEDTQTVVRLLAARPTLARLVRDGNRAQLELFLKRYCSVAGMSGCAVAAADGAVLGANSATPGWTSLLEAVSEQGEHFLFYCGRCMSAFTGILRCAKSVTRSCDCWRKNHEQATASDHSRRLGSDPLGLYHGATMGACGLG